MSGFWKPAYRTVDGFLKHSKTLWELDNTTKKRLFMFILLLKLDLKITCAHTHIYMHAYLRYRNVSKTDVKAGWLRHPKSGPPKQVQTVEDMHPPSEPNYKYACLFACTCINELYSNL